jgi:hypothetical protein
VLDGKRTRRKNAAKLAGKQGGVRWWGKIDAFNITERQPFRNRIVTGLQQALSALVSTQIGRLGRSCNKHIQQNGKCNEFSRKDAKAQRKQN